MHLLNASLALPAFFFFLLGFTPCKAEQPPQGMELQEKKRKKKTKKITGYRKSI